MSRIIVIVTMLLLPALLSAQKYRITWRKAGAWIGYGISGGLHGGRDAMYADQYVFEKKWGVGSRSFFGSKQWVRQYRRWDPEREHKWNGLNFTRDYWHMSHFVGTYIRDASDYSIANSNQKKAYKVIDFLIGSVAYSFSSWATYNYLRK